jgi:hypothetical protein
MEDRAYLALSLIAIILGASGLGIGAFSVINFQKVEGPQGLQGPPGPQGSSGQNGTDGQDGIDGLNGTDGRDAPGWINVGIIDPDYGETISGSITIRAIIFGSDNYSISIFGNSSEIGTSLPMEWNSTTVVDGWWNITIVAVDITTNNVSTDEVLVFIMNHYIEYNNVMPNLIIPSGTEVFFNFAAESIVHLPNSFTNMMCCLYRFVIPDNYITSENIIFHIVWGSSVQNPTTDYGISFYYSADGDTDTSIGYIQSSWTGAGQGKRNFESLNVSNLLINPGNLLMVKVYMEDQNDLEPTFCYAVWLEVPVN